MNPQIKVALILPGSIWYAPYVRNYTRILDTQKTEYEIISWNREGDDKPEGFQYNEISCNGHGSASLLSYIRYINFIKKTIKGQRFSHVIVFGPQMTCLLSAYLFRHFRYRYIIDYRDLSIEQKAGFRQIFSIMLRFSFANVISSPGFKRCLPNVKYYLSHNFDVNAVYKTLNSKIEECQFKTDNGIDVVTIGAIRDYSSNIEVTKALVNEKGFSLRFIGRGDRTVEKLKAYCIKSNAKNVMFVDSYDKPEEADYVKTSTFLNIFYPRIITHDTALSNRFYNSLIYHRPMIVTKDTCQGDFVEKYNVGIAVNDCNNLTQELKSFIEQDFKEYAKRCDFLLREFLKDQEHFENVVVNFVTTT